MAGSQTLDMLEAVLRDIDDEAFYMRNCPVFAIPTAPASLFLDDSGCELDVSTSDTVCRRVGPVK